MTPMRKCALCETTHDDPGTVLCGYCDCDVRNNRRRLRRVMLMVIGICLAVAIGCAAGLWLLWEAAL